jgi:hypothetical protein
LIAAPAAAHEGEAGVDDSDGWSASSLLRGPMAIVNGVTLPFRSLWGSFTNGVWGAVLFPASTAWGFAQGVQLGGVGVLETVSAGYFELVPDESTTLNLNPVLQLPVQEENFSLPPDEVADAGS